MTRYVTNTDENSWHTGHWLEHLRSLSAIDDTTLIPPIMAMNFSVLSKKLWKYEVYGQVGIANDDSEALIELASANAESIIDEPRLK